MWKLRTKRNVSLFGRKRYFCPHSKPCYMRKFSLIACLALMMSAFMIACKQDNSAKQQARLMVVNAAIGAPISTSLAALPIGPAIDVKWDGTFITPNVVYGSASYGTFVSNGSTVGNLPVPASPAAAVPQQLIAATYTPVKSGAYGLNLSVTANQNPPYLGGNTIYDRTTSFLPGKSYTALSFDFTPFYKVQFMEDDLAAPPSGKIKVRFVHAVPQAIFTSLGVPRRDTIDVTAFGGASSNPLNNSSVFSLRTFADGYTNNRLHQFTVLDSGSYRFGVRIAGTPGTSGATGLLGLFPASGTPLRLTDGKIYTIVARLNPSGAPAPNQLAPGITIITHN